MKKLIDFQIQQKNANSHTPRGMGVLEGSIQQDGWIGAITVAADGETFDGSARLEVGARTGFDEVEPIVIESDGTRPVIVKRTDIPSADDERAIRLGIAANRAAELNLSWAPSVLSGLADDGMDLSAYFFPHELAGILEQAGTEILDANQLWKGMPEFEQEDQESWKSIKVHFQNKDDYEAFARLVGQALTQDTKSMWYPPRKHEDRQAYSWEDEPEVSDIRSD